MEQTFSFNHLEKAFGNHGPSLRKWAEKRRSGDDAKNRGVRYERSYAVAEILKIAKICLEKGLDGDRVHFSARPETLVDDLLVELPRTIYLVEAKFRKRLNWGDIEKQFSWQYEWNKLIQTGKPVVLKLVVPHSDQIERLSEKIPKKLESVRVELFECKIGRYDFLREYFFVEHQDASTLANLQDYVETAWLRLNFSATGRQIMKAAADKARFKIRSLEPDFELDIDTKSIFAGISDMKITIMGESLKYESRGEPLIFWLPFSCGSDRWKNMISRLKDASPHPKTFLEFARFLGATR